MKYFTQIIFLSILMQSTAFAAATFSPVCPKEVTPSKQTVEHVTGWETFNPESRHFLQNITLYSGHPNESASLKPEISNTKRSVWDFSPKDKIYIACEYRQTAVQLIQALPDGTRQCTLSYQANSEYVPDRMTCTN